MPKYAVEIGKVMLQSDRPITEPERKEALRLLAKYARVFPVEHGAVIIEPKP